MATSRTSGKASEEQKAAYTRRAGAPSGARSEAAKIGAPEGKPVAQAWENPELTRVERVITFLEALPVTKGILAGRRMQLLPDQRDFVEDVYGERDVPVQIGVKSEARGNGKTGLISGLALCHLLGPEAERRGEVYSAAKDRPQAAILHAEMAAIIRAVPSFAARCNVQRFLKKIEVLEGPGEGSVYEALPADARRGHGLAPSLWIYDELAQAKDSELLQSLRTGMGKRVRSLGLVISTQAPDDEHPLSQLIDEGLSGDDPTILVHLTAAPDDADPFAEETIRAANPALGIFLDEKIVFAEAAQARRRPLFLPKFLNLRLNRRVDAENDQRLAHAADWRRGDVPVDLERLAGRPCIGGLDLSAKHDLTALELVFPESADDTYDVLSFFWTPLERLEDRTPMETERLRLWIQSGHVEGIPGPIIRYDVVAARIAELAERFDIQAIAYDKWRIEDLKLDLADLGLELPLEPFGQGHSPAMAPAIEYFDELVVTGRIRHGGNPALTASVLNAVIVRDKAGNPMIDKSRTRRAVARVDGAVALVMALGTARRFVGSYVEDALVVA